MRKPFDLAAYSSSELQEIYNRKGKGMTILIPVAATEQHGRYAAIDLDNIIAKGVAEAAAQRLQAQEIAAFVAPAIQYGFSDIPTFREAIGTISLSQDTFISLLTEIGAAFGSNFPGARIVFVNAHDLHPGLFPVILTKLYQLKTPGSETVYAAATVSEMIDQQAVELLAGMNKNTVHGHACLIETSMALALGMHAFADYKTLKDCSNYPQHTNPVLNAAFNAPKGCMVYPWADPDVAPSIWGDDMQKMILGDPAGSSPEIGQKLIAAAAEVLLGFVKSLLLISRVE